VTLGTIRALSWTEPGTTLLLLAAASLGVALAEPAPPPGAAPAAQPEFFVHLKGVPISRLVTHLSEQAGERVGAAEALQDLKVTALLQRVSVATVQRALAELFHARWEEQAGQEGEIQPTLTPIKDPLDQQKTALAVYEGLLRHKLVGLVHQCKGGALPNYLAQSPGVPEAERAQWVADMSGRAAVIGSLPADWVNALVHGDAVRVVGADAKGELRKSLSGYARSQAMTVAAGWEPRQLDTAEIEFRSYDFYPGVHLGLPLRGLCFSFYVHGELSSTNYVPVDARDFRDSLTQSLAEAGVPGPWDSAQPARRYSDLPGVLPGGQGLALPEALEGVADRFRINILSDHHTPTPGPWEPRWQLPKDAGLDDALDSIAATFHQTWRQAGDCYLLRSLDWWFDDAMEVPEQRVEGWRGKLKTRGRLELEDMAEIAALPDVAGDRLVTLFPEAALATGNRPLLRFFSLLSGADKAKARSEGGLPLGDSRERLAQVVAGYRAMPGSSAGSATVTRLSRLAQEQGTALEVQQQTDGMPRAVFLFRNPRHSGVSFSIPLALTGGPAKPAQERH